MKKQVLFLCVFCVLALTMGTLTAAKDNGKSWGLSFGAPGEKPNGNDTAKYLSAYDAYFVGSGEEKNVYLTFDAGFENGNTEKILDTLKEKNVPAAFFLVGTYIEQYPDLIKRMVSEGHIVGNHTMHHKDMPMLSNEAFANELKITEDAYKTVTGSDMPKFYRPPSGRYSEQNLEAAKELGYKTVFWSLAYVDWNVDKQPSKEEAFNKLMPRLHPGTILLLHSTSATNADILGELIDKYRGLGYEFLSLLELGDGVKAKAF